MTVATTGVAVTTSSSPPSSPPSSSIEQYRARSSSFGSITPTFSSDLAKLRAACCGSDGDGNTHAGNTTTAAAATTNGGVNKEPYVVHSYTKAIAIATTFDIFGPNSPLCQKLKLNNNKQRTTTTVEENENENENKKVWIEFINQSGAAVVIGDKQQPFFDDNAGSNNDNNSSNNNNNNNDVNVAIQMEKLLRYCFDVAFKLPPSNGHVRTVSSSGRNIRLPPGPPML
jgi:hypothetical protein